MLAVIGGSGLTELANLTITRREVVRTPYGEPSGALTFGELCGRPVAFLARHGYGHTIAPHRVNYAANLWALRHAGASSIVAVASVGGIRADLDPGVLLVPDQIIDYTWGRKSTFFESADEAIHHIDFTEPFDATVRGRLLSAASDAGVDVVDGGVYATTQGPRLETLAEIARIERDGGDVVGMTAMPEAALARELDIPYAAINVVANHAAGKGSSEKAISFERIEASLQESMVRVRLVLGQLCKQ